MFGLPKEQNFGHVHTKPELISIPVARFRHVHIDVVGPLPTSEGFNYCLIMIDRFSRWPEAAPLSSTSAEDIVNTFFTAWIARFGAPRTITTDRGLQFESTVFDSFTKLLGSRIRTTAYHPASNGIIKRWHRSLKAAITCHANRQWTKLLPTVLLGLRTAIKEDIKTSAAEMLYGEYLTLPGEFFLDFDAPSDLGTFAPSCKTSGNI